jgi:hypothetical protein
VVSSGWFSAPRLAADGLDGSARIGGREGQEVLKRVRGLVLAAVVALQLICPPGTASGAVECVSNLASIRFASNYCPSSMRNGSFATFLWVYRTQSEPSQRGVLQIPGVASVFIESDGSASAVLRSASAPTTTLSVHATGSNVGSGQWALICLSYDKAAGRADLHVRTQSASVISGSATAPAFTGANLGPPTGEVAIGVHTLGVQGMIGLYGLIAARFHSVSVLDVEQVFASRRYFAAMDLNNLSVGGSMTGIDGCDWMLNHSMSTLPLNAGAGGPQHERAAVVGLFAGLHNAHLYQKSFSSSVYTRFRAAYPCNVATGFTYRSHRDPPYGGFFIVDTPNAGVPPQSVSADLPKARMLATYPRGLVRVMTSANSRAVKAFDGSGLSPGNYMHGLIEKHRDRTAGVLLRPVLLQSGTNPWFGFDASDNPHQSAPGTIVDIESDPGPIGDFARFFTGSGNPDSTARGAGVGLFMLPGSFYSLRCREEPGSLVLATEPLVVEALLLAFPGSASMAIRPDKGTSQQAPGSQGAETIVPLDTTAHQEVLDANDLVIDASQLALEGDLRPLIEVGDACFVESGPASGAISIAQTVTFDGARTVIAFERPLGATPGIGSTLRFGPWSFVTHSFEWPGLELSDPQTWRGLAFSPIGEGSGAIVMALSAYRPDVDGFVWGASGWGGHGYTEQIDGAFASGTLGWMGASQADVWIQVPAQQRSPTSSMSDFLAYIRAALPEADVVWAAEMEHATGTFATWHSYILTNAAAHGVAGLSVLQDARLGTMYEQFAEGIRSDTAHISQRGNRRLADLWIEQLASAAIDPCPPDVNFDGLVDVLDFLEFLDAFGTGRAWADVTGDGLVDVLDFLEFLDQFGAGCT